MENDNNEESVEQGTKRNESEVIPPASDTGIDVDQALVITGGFGRFQLIIQVITMSFVLTTSYHTVLSYFIANDPPWTCVSNTTSEFCEANMNKTFSLDHDFFSKRCELDRSEWTYTTAKSYSYVTEYELICKDSSLGATVSAVYFIGGLFGSIISGKIADAYGRVPVLIASLLFTVVPSIASSFITNIWQLLVLRSVLGAAHVSCYTISYVYLMEIVAPDHRVVSGAVFQITFCISCALLDLYAYFERRWRKLQLYSSFACLPVLVLYMFFPESPRWYFATNKNNLAEKGLKKINRVNKKPEMDIHLKSSSDSENKNNSYLHLFTTKKVAILTSSLAWIWTGLSLSYYAVALESSNLGGDMYTSFVYTSLVDIPSTFGTLYSCDRFGRKKTILGGSFLGGVFLIAITLVPKSYESRYAVVVTLVTLAKFFTEVAFNGAYIWSFELYPTALRSQGLSFCVTFEKIGAIAAPYLASVLMEINVNLPFIIMASFMLVGSFLGLLLPETKKMPTRETFDDFFEKKVKIENGHNIGVVNEALDSAV